MSTVHFKGWRHTFMPEGDEAPVYYSESHNNTGKWILIGVAIAYVAISAYLLYAQHAKLDKIAQDESASQKQVAELNKRMQSAEADAETLAQQLGMTKKELASRAAQLQKQQAASVAKLAEEQKKELSLVAGEVGTVKTDVGGVKTDLGTTKASLEETRAQLQRTIGDLGVQSGLIANTRGDLEALKHKGDRQYYEFTLLKGANPQAFSTVAL